MSDKKNISGNDFEDSFEKSLKSLGYLFPSTEDEVDSFEENNKMEEIPEIYCNPIDLLSKSKSHLPNFKNTIDFNKSMDNLARAARNGGEISDVIINKMKSDRDKSENGEK
ncbi:MAG: hypothetical protein HXX16_12265 [Bacteroidales bacterium]|nr:hypothetical protein [Bacteroidales bacterium]